MQNSLTVYKKLGETPLEALERARGEHGIGGDVAMTYAGRLDPLAEGQMIVLVGEECKNKDAYTKLGKSYEFEILSSVATDTYDVLGLVMRSDFSKLLDVDEVVGYLQENIKAFSQNYPPYSSKTFKGKQLHTHAREGNTPALKHEVSLYDCEFLDERTVPGWQVLETVLGRIDLVHGDFRQDEIKAKWEEVFKNKGDQEFQITKWRVDVSSGFYIRQLVHDIGERFGMPTVTFHIKRTRVG